jgi:adenylate kinase
MKASLSLAVLGDGVKVRIVVLGPPGTGKGSLAALCEQHLGIPYVSTGQLFREQIARKTKLGLEVQSYVSRGQLAPDELVVRVMTRQLARKEFIKGFILDGFPRTVEQAKGLEEALERLRTPLQGALYVSSPQETLIRRLSGRRVCPNTHCGATYHTRTMRPKVVGTCDHCGSALTTRVDDQPETISKRLAVDAENAKPLLAYYRSRKLLYRVDGRGHINTVYRRTRELFRRLGWIRSTQG